MAEVVVRPVINRLADLLYGEAVLFGGVRKEVEGLKYELESINSFLKDAESKSEREANEGVKTWVKQVRDEANHIEDVIDEYIRHVSPRAYDRGFVGFLHKVVRSIKKLKERHKIASEVEDIRASLREIKERSDRYRFHSSHEDESKRISYDPRLDSIFIEEEEVVGIDSARAQLLSMLVEGKASRGVISLVGTGGVGKTTLANQVYENKVAKRHFSCRAWITVSQSYDTKKLLKNMIDQICIGSETNSTEANDIQGLIRSIREFLKTEMYMIVFDDVWDEDFWEIVKNALPKNKKGSRVIVTTRNHKTAAVSCQESLDDMVQRVEPLSEDMAWKLFCKKAFRSQTSEPNCPKELEELSREIARKCHGLPLVITAIAGLMATKEKNVAEWQNVLNNMSSEFESHSKLTSALQILSLSYNDLPHHLKPCFLYFGIFPEDFSISEARLYRYWIAEGFVKPQKGKTSEDVAKEYLDELIHRNLVEASYWECRIFYKMCKVHDMMREVILFMGDDLGFCQILDKRNKTFKRKYRRLSINGDEENVQGIVEDSTVRSIFLFNVDKLTTPFVVSLFEKFKLLRVLEFRGCPLDFLPKTVGNLFHLKYLGLAKTKVKSLPKTVGKLQNLQTLDVYETLVQQLPLTISNLPRMRHIYHTLRNDAYWDASINVSSDPSFSIKMPRRIGSLENLQTLGVVEAEDYDSIKELEKLRHLRDVAIVALTTELGKALCASISNTSHLQYSSLLSVSSNETLDLESISFPPRELIRLVLDGPLLKFPHWISDLLNLVELILLASDLCDNPLKFISSLSNLQRLVLYEAYNKGKLHFKEGGFMKLKVLQLALVGESEVMEIDNGALPRLEVLEITDSQLKNVPAGIEHLTNLKTLRLKNMSEEFVSTIRPEDGQDYDKVRHISSITLWSTMHGCKTITRLRDSDHFNICCPEHLQSYQRYKWLKK